MKRSLFILLLLFPLVCFADQVKVQVRYERYLYQCPCGNEFIETSNQQKYTCPICKAVLGEGQYKSLGDSIYFDYDEYQKIDGKVIDEQIGERTTQAIYNIKHPAPIVEPTKIDLENQKAELQKQIDELTIRINEKDLVFISD